jgi:hypothetical protein
MVPTQCPAIRSLEFSLIAIINIVGRKRRINLHTKDYKAKLEKLRSARLTRYEQLVNF